MTGSTITRTAAEGLPPGKRYFITDKHEKVAEIQVIPLTRSTVYFSELIRKGEAPQASLAARMAMLSFEVPAIAQDTSVRIETFVDREREEVLHNVIVTDQWKERSRQSGFGAFEKLLTAAAGVERINEPIPAAISSEGRIIRTTEEEHPNVRHYSIFDGRGNRKSVRVTKLEDDKDAICYEEFVSGGDDPQETLTARIMRVIFADSTAARDISVEVHTTADTARREFHYSVSVRDIGKEPSDRDGIEVCERLLLAATGIEQIDGQPSLTISP